MSTGAEPAFRIDLPGDWYVELLLSGSGQPYIRIGCDDSSMGTPITWSDAERMREWVAAHRAAVPTGSTDR